MVSKWIKGGKAAWGAIVGVKPKTTTSHALEKFKARVKGIEEGAAEGTKRYKGDLPKATMEKVEKKVKIAHKSEAVKKLLKENQ
jgi:hypothetical protein